MGNSEKISIIDVTGKEGYEIYLYKCLSPMPFKIYKNRENYLRYAIPKGFRKKVLLFNGEAVGQIEYAPASASGYPIYGEKLLVMNCIWVLRKAKGHNFGLRLLKSMIQDQKMFDRVATIALENHWSPWMKKWQMEKLGFKPVDKITVKHKVKHREKCFKIFLMWLPIRENATPPKWDKTKMLKGVKFCMAHPLYNADRWKLEYVFEPCNDI